MKKFFKSLLFFVLFAIFAYAVLIFVWGFLNNNQFKTNLNFKKGSTGFLYTRIKDQSKYKNIDILFLGSSRAYRGFDNRIFEKNNYTSFNFGSSGQTPIQTNLILNRYLDQLNPKTIVYAVAPEMLSNDGVESALDFISNDKNDLLSLKMAIQINQIKVYNSLIFAYFIELLNIDKNYAEPKRKGNDYYIEGGFVEREDDRFSSKIMSNNNSKFAQNQLNAFNKIVSKIKHKNIKLILVYAPILNSKNSKDSVNFDFENLMCESSIYYNFNRFAEFNDTTFFYDSIHLNNKGVEAFNKKLIEILNDDKN